MKKSVEQLTNELHQTIPMIGQRFRHYKGNEYEVRGASIDCDTNEVRLHYTLVNTPDADLVCSNAFDITWSRSLSAWNEIIDDEGTKRFEKIIPVTVQVTESEYKLIRENRKEWIGKSVNNAGQNIKWYRRLWTLLGFVPSVETK